MIRGKKHSKKTRKKISDALTGKPRSQEVCDKISKSSMGKRGNCGTFKVGHKHSDEAIEKIRAAKIGQPTWNKGLKGIMKPNSGSFQKGHSLGVRFGRDKDSSGENHNNWKGGISREPYGLGWTNTLKESIRERDGHQCQQCEILQNKLKEKWR